MWEISYKGIQRYFNLLQNTGYIPYNDVYDILSLVILEEFINESFQDLISENDLHLLQKYLTTLFNKTCLIGCFPETINMEYWSNAGTSSDVDTKINALTTSLAEVKADVNTVQSNIVTISTNISSLKSTVASNTANINTNTKNISSQATSIDTLNTTTTNQASQIKDLQTKDTTLEKDITTINNTLTNTSNVTSQLKSPRILSLGGIISFKVFTETTSALGGGQALGSSPVYSTTSRIFYITYNGKNYSSWFGFSDIADITDYNSEENLYFTGTALYRKSGTSFIDIGGDSSSNLDERVSALENNVSALSAVQVLKVKS